MFYTPIPRGPDPTIHPSWCKCSDCQDDVTRRRELRGDYIALGFGLVAALVILGGDQLLRSLGVWDQLLRSLGAWG